MMDSCYMEPPWSLIISFTMEFSMTRREWWCSARFFTEKNSTKSPNCTHLEFCYFSQESVDNSGEGFGSTYQAFCTWRLQSFDVFPAIQQHADDDDHRPISFPPSKEVFSSDKGLWHLLPDSLSTWILGISWVPFVTASFKVDLLRKGWSSSSPK